MLEENLPSILYGFPKTYLYKACHEFRIGIKKTKSLWNDAWRVKLAVQFLYLSILRLILSKNPNPHFLQNGS